MKAWFKDAWDDVSSGALLRFAAFIVVLGMLVEGLVLSVPVDGLLLLVGIFVVVVVETNAALSIQGAGVIQSPDDKFIKSMGLLSTPAGKFDPGRLIKLVAFGVAVVIAAVFVAVLPGRLPDAAKICGVLVGISMAQDVFSKAAGT